MEQTASDIWNITSKELEKIICRKVNHQDCCHDILQEVYLKINTNLNKIRKANNIPAYVTRLTNNIVADHHRSKKIISQIDSTSEPSSFIEKEKDPTRQLAQTFLIEAIESLPPVYKYALMKTELEGISQKHLAIELNMSYPGLKSRVQRAKKMLRERILSCCDYKFDKYGNVISCCGSSCC